MAAPPTANKATKLVAGTLVAGRYKVVREIGRGGMAQVYEGKHADIGKSVAIKVLAAEFITSPVVVERFLREARAAAAVRSPYICDVHDQGKLDDGRPFLVMELLEGESLYERMVRVRQFDPKTTVRIITHVARGLMKAHAANIVHRDLKPENIFLTTNEDGEMHAKILDFGLAKFYAPSNDGAAQARLTREGAIFGTPAYMSPEQVQGQGAVDHRADIWALGCIAYECLTGRTVWSTDKGIAMTFAQIASAPIPQITKYRPDLPRSIDEWFEKALSRDIETRYQTAKDLAEGFAQALAEGPPSLMMVGELSAVETPLVPASLTAQARAELSPPAAGKPVGGTVSSPIELGTPLPPEPTPAEPRPVPKGNESLTNETATSSTVKGPPPRRSPARVLVPVAAVALAVGVAAAGAWQMHRSQGSQALTQPTAQPSASGPGPALAPSSGSATAQVEASPAPGPKWLPLVTEGQARVLAGELDEASKRFKEAQDTMGSAVARALNDHVSAAQGNKGPCRLGALGRVRPFSLSGGSTGRPTLVRAGTKLVVFWTDDHESLQHDHAYALQLDAQTLKPIGQPIDVTPEAERVGRLAAAVVGEKIALAFTDTRGRGAGLYLRWLDATGSIAAPAVPLAPLRAAFAQPSLWTEGNGVWAAWEEQTDKTDVFVAKVSPGAAPPAGARLTDLRKGRLKPRVVGPQIAAGQGSLEVVFRVDRDATRPVTLLHVPETDPALAQGLGPAGPQSKDDRVVGQMKVLAAANAKGDVPSHKGDSPELACGRDGCFAVWHIERAGPVGGWFAALIDGKSGEVTWSKKFAGGGGRPSIGQNEDGSSGVAWFEGGRVRVAPINRDGVGPSSMLAHIAGDQPPASIVGAGGHDWAVAWLDFEGGKLEPYVLRAACPLPPGSTSPAPAWSVPARLEQSRACRGPPFAVIVRGRLARPMVHVPMLQIPPRHEVRRRPIETPRLWLYPLETADAPEMWTSVESCRAYLEPWLPWVPFQTEPQSSVQYAEASMGDWDYGRALRFAIRERPARRFLGVVSLESLQHLNLSCDLGYWLRKDSNGRGLMTEAAGTLVTWAFRQLGAHRIRVAAATDNHGSLAVIRRLGFRFEGIARQAELIAGRWLDHAIFAKLTTD